jgi:nucleoside permease NupC
MRFIGILGIIVLLGAAYLMSNNRKKICLRTVIWGLVLQLLFAAVILGAPAMSYLAMLLLLGMVIIFILRSEINTGFIAGSDYFTHYSKWSRLFSTE